MNYYRRYVGDYLRDTSRLTLLEHGAYTLMLDYYYSDERPLPSSREEIYLLVRAMTPADRKAVDKVLSIYFTELADGWHQSRVDEEIERAHDASETAKMAGAKGAQSRWGRRPPPADDGGPYGGSHGGGYGEPHSGGDGGQHGGIDGESMAGSMATRAGDPTTNHQPPPANLQPPDLLTPSPKPGRGEARASRLPLDWIPSPEALEWTATTRPAWAPARITETIEAFRDYWRAKAGKDATKRDWDATWRNWVRREDANGKGQAARSTPRTDPDAMDRLLGNVDARH